MPLRPDLVAAFTNPDTLARAKEQARRVIDSIRPELSSQSVPWFNEDTVDQVVDKAPERFNEALDRWRNLYDATLKQI